MYFSVMGGYFVAIKAGAFRHMIYMLQESLMQRKRQIMHHHQAHQPGQETAAQRSSDVL